MKTLYLDPTTWDLVVDSAGNIATATEPYRLAQDAATAIRTFLGECIYDTTLGVPYWTEILGKLAPTELIRARLSDAALSVPGVVDATVYLTASDRRISGQVQVTDTDGNVTAANF